MPASSQSSLVKRLRAFELRGGLAGAEAEIAGGAQIVAEPGDHRGVGADDDEVDRRGLGEGDDRGMVGDVEHDILGDAAGAAIAGRDEQLFEARRLRDGPGQRMFTATRTDHQYAHVRRASLC